MQRKLFRHEWFFGICCVESYRTTSLFDTELQTAIALRQAYMPPFRPFWKRPQEKLCFQKIRKALCILRKNLLKRGGHKESFRNRDPKRADSSPLNRKKLASD